MGKITIDTDDLRELITLAVRDAMTPESGYVGMDEVCKRLDVKQPRTAMRILRDRGVVVQKHGRRPVVKREHLEAIA